MRKAILTMLALMMAATCTVSQAIGEDAPVFRETSVHDPSIIKADDGYFYIYGSHMAAARSLDLMAWETISQNAQEGCTLVENVQEEMKTALSWAQTKTFWAPCVQQLKDGRYYMYYCCCRGDSPLSALGLAVSDKPEGPFKDLGVFLYSGMQGKSADGTRYDATKHPNVIDPHTFYDKNGKLWMVYGSYSGGIYILEMNDETGFPLEGQGYGKKLLGKNHSRIEGPFILYAPETDYYYLFLSFGGLDSKGGYNIRVARSKNPDGPYLDAKGQDMNKCGGRSGSFFLDVDIVDFGTKLMGGYQFKALEGEPNRMVVGFVSPGHNSAIYLQETNQYFLIFHTRFLNGGEAHSVRVHQFYFNEAGWPVITPYRYAGEKITPVAISDIAGEYKVINHQSDINAKPHRSDSVMLNTDGTLSGNAAGTWQSFQDNRMEITLDGVAYNGVFVKAFDNQQKVWTITFTAMSEAGVALWGSRNTVAQ